MKNATEHKAEFFAEPTWAIVELMGHQVVAGQITEVVVAGAAMLRVDVPGIPADLHNEEVPAYTRFMGTAALYSIIPTDEASARHAAAHLRVRPVSPYTIPTRAIAAPRDDYDDAQYRYDCEGVSG